jgi:hypothetical protein
VLLLRSTVEHLIIQSGLLLAAVVLLTAYDLDLGGCLVC